MRTLATICVAAALASCAARQPVTWYKPGGTDEQFRRDQMSCAQYGMQSAQAHGLAGNLFVDKWIADEATQCMHQLGYSTQAP